MKVAGVSSALLFASLAIGQTQIPPPYKQLAGKPAAVLCDKVRKSGARRGLSTTPVSLGVEPDGRVSWIKITNPKKRDLDRDPELNAAFKAVTLEGFNVGYHGNAGWPPQEYFELQFDCSVVP